MSGHRPGRHSPWRTPDEHPHPHLVAVRQADRDSYEVTLSPGAGVADLVAAAGILPHGVVYSTHRRPANPEHEQSTAAILVFQKPPIDPADTGDPGGVPAHPSPSGGPPPPPARLFAEATPDPSSDVPAAVEEALAPLVASVLLTAPGRHVVHPTHAPTTHARTTHAPVIVVHPTVFHDDPATPSATSDDSARHDQQAA